MKFVDTNVLIYAACSDPREETKRFRAQALLNEPDLAVSVQVLGEFYHQATRPSRPGGITHEQASKFLEFIETVPVQDMTVGVFREAIAIRKRFEISYWDAAILAAARAVGCDVVYSEDLSATQDYSGIRVINPFASLTP